MSNYKYAVVIPTCAEASILIESVPRFFNNAEDSTIFIFSFNPKNMETALSSERLIKFFYDQASEYKDIDYNIIWSDKPIGFGAAVNKGTKYLEDTYGLSDHIIIANDDLQVTKNWSKQLADSFGRKHFTTRSKAILNKDNKEESLIDIDVLGSKVGMVGPMSNGVFNEQSVGGDSIKVINQFGIDRFAYEHNQVNKDVFMKTMFLSGYCFMISRECFEDMRDSSFEYGGIFDTRFKIGGYEDDDLCHRMAIKGWSMMIDASTVIGHKVSQTLQMHFADSRSGMHNGLEFLLKWEDETQREQRIIGAYRTSLKCVNDVNQLHNSLLRSSVILDGISILLTNNPKEVLQSYDQMMVQHLPLQSQKFVQECSNIDGTLEESKTQLIDALTNFLVDILPEDYPINVDIWTGDFNERDERNRTHELSEELGAEWIMSVDSDEIFEDRLTKEHIQKIVQNPNPSRNQFSTQFLNHWENMKLIREDKHYGTMAGLRLWKCYKNPFRIVSGNNIGFHCGNSPEYGKYGQRMSHLRMRHLSHVRRVDRDHKAQFYNNLDKDRKLELVGDTNYNHINQENDIKVSIYNPKNGLGLTMLCYSKEDWIDYQIWFDQMYAVADKICLVWTDNWNEEDKDWTLQIGNIKGISKEDFEKRYRTGPSWEMAQLTRLYKVEWVHSELKEDTGLASCRNAGIDYLNDNNDGSLGWVLFMDPDEMPQNWTTFLGELLNKLTRSDNYGYMFKFSNPTSDGTISGSESIRLVKLNDYIRLSGVVHETFEHCFRSMHDQGLHPKVLYFDNQFVNRGLSKSPEQMAEKLLKYRDMLCKQLSLDPFHSGSWVSLALQYLNDDDFNNAEECFNRAIVCAGTGYLAFKEYSFFLLRKAQIMLAESHRRTNSSHNFWKISKQMHDVINSWNLDLPKVDTGGISISDTTVLPIFPSKEELEQLVTSRLENEIQHQNEESKNE